MRLIACCVALPVLFLSASADAHFKLQQPADRLQTDAAGDPPGGTQKSNPCGQGTPSGAVTQVRAGSTLHVKLTETVPHGGHYRIALVPKLSPTSSDLPEPEVTLESGQCGSAANEDPVVAPVLADNLFPHTQAEATPGRVWETDVRLPAQTGDATLQIIEFMTPHAPQCFYHHCADLQILAADASIDDDAGGVIVRAPDASHPDASAAPASSAPAEFDDSSGGCSTGGGAAPGLFAFLPLGLALIARRRRRSESRVR
jgi:MYXO-CTERM domain-containing protein